MRSRTVVLGFVLLVAPALFTGSVLLIGYIAAAASLLAGVTLLVKRAIRRESIAPTGSFVPRWVDAERSGGGVTAYLINTAGADAPVRQQERRVKASRETRAQHESQRERRPTANVDQVLDDSFPASDPPSWTGAISRVASTPEPNQRDERIAGRIRAEFLEMPGLCLTIEQAQRLWSLEPRMCETLLRSLIDSRFLRRTDRGLFVLHRPRS